MDMHEQGSQPPAELPAPVIEQPTESTDTGSAGKEQSAAKLIEQGVSLPATDPANPGQPQAAGFAQSSQQPFHAVASLGTYAQPTSATPLIADDTDLIEKEWVDKAKHIVEQTRHDPRQQNKEINTIKADYLKKRYNKDLKLSE
jgi:hypothetical protein